MKKSVKKFLSAVLASALICQTVAAASISVYADTSEPAEGDVYVWFDSSSADNNNADNDTDVFVVNHTQSSTNTLTTGSASVTIGSTKYTVSKRTDASSDNVTVKVPGTVTSATLYCVLQSGDSSSKTLTLTDSSETTTKTITVAGSGTYPYVTNTSVTGLSQGTWTLSASGSYSIGMLALYVTEIGEVTEEFKYDYTLTGSISGLAANVTSLTLTNTSTNEEYTAEVSDDTYTLTAEHAAASPFKNQTFSASVPGYDCEETEFTLGSGTTHSDGSVTYTHDLTFTSNAQRQIITDSAYFDAGCLPSGTISSGDVFGTYFELYSSGSNTASRASAVIDSYGNLNYDYRLDMGGKSRDIKFTIAGDALIQVVFSSNNTVSRSCAIGTSADSSAVCTISSDSNGKTKPTIITWALSGDENGTDYYIYSTGNGISIYSINIVVGGKLTTNSNKISAYVNGDSSYVLCGIAEDELSQGDTLTISGSLDEIASTKTVYAYVGVDNFVFEASKVINSSAGYIYGAELTGSPSDAGDIIISKVTAEVADA